MNVTKRNGATEPFSPSKIEKAVNWAVDGTSVESQEVIDKAILLIYDGIKTSDIQQALIKGAAKLVSATKADASLVSARLLLLDLYKTVCGEDGKVSGGGFQYPHIKDYLEKGVSLKLLDPELLNYDLERINAAIKPERDLSFHYLGLDTLADRYFIRANRDIRLEKETGNMSGNIIELPQHFWMRVAMGVALKEKPEIRTSVALAYYELYSKLEYVSSTPTLFNAGTLHPQLSSCYLNQVSDTIAADEGDNRFASIFGAIEETALLSKFAGGIGTDWTPVRGENELIFGTNGISSGVVPYIKVQNNTAVAVNQGGKRKGSVAPYLEAWHPDFMAFCELKRESGDDRRRAHDVFPAAWVPDLLIERKEDPNAMWSFFSPKRFPELHELYGEDFVKRYEELEAAGEYDFQLPAIQVWRHLLTNLFETGHPWITYKDECNRRNPQQHAGVIHHSNLCTEITLNTSKDETAVCNLGSINLSQVMSAPNPLERLREVIRLAIRNLDSVIDVNYYPSDRASNSNFKHRPIGLGVMGYYEWLVKQGVDFESEEHLKQADALFEAISYFAIEASADLAQERGSYPSFEGSNWSKGILPIDNAKLMEDGKPFFDQPRRFDWEALREKVKKGMRNSNVMAIAPTATISNIAGTTQCTEPPFLLEYFKSNLGGTYQVVDPAIAHVGDKYHLLKESYYVDQLYIIKAAAVRQKWIDQSQSTNLFAKQGTTGRDLDLWYTTAKKLGLKTTYYLRNQSDAEKSASMQTKVIAELANAALGKLSEPTESAPKMCSILDPDCESCQ
ncbi:MULTISPECIES: ribonucleoside-diphosphate reductase subunit alpha [Acinetobacter]|uniref:ribonucleoside-diphosphate reductase subunit alpha n=1 Tax=Acinetobacter TaxID=469 RepID=UPI0012FB3DDA|nr:ribonucleoside-diphosphate reductase subunit alpha [Acinetobacter baumannii]EHU1359852.1 ribonucleoside-diphosphate reductase subunit alpha [Acinetobacter baumannii]KAA0671914.1 ribonucleoside-diphosphate reductase subunit alpha [Acinetobacter baumannii]UAB18200.1 ribonucleoside-diphosphate reductase subunit alpha [Acinetobacter baumannii]